MPSPNQNDASFVLTGRHVLLGMICFFGVIFAVNAYFINVALSTNTGVVSKEPYRKGLNYNDRIAESERQAQLGWHDKITLAPEGDKISIRLNDKDGKTVNGLNITALIGRPASEEDDVTVTLSETSQGTYEAAIPVRAAGNYIASIEAIDPSRAEAGILYRAKERLWLKP